MLQNELDVSLFVLVMGKNPNMSSASDVCTVL